MKLRQQDIGSKEATVGITATIFLLFACFYSYAGGTDLSSTSKVVEYIQVDDAIFHPHNIILDEISMLERWYLIGEVKVKCIILADRIIERMRKAGMLYGIEYINILKEFINNGDDKEEFKCWVRDTKIRIEQNKGCLIKIRNVPE